MKDNVGAIAEKGHRERAAVGDINESQIVITLRSDELSAVEMWPLPVAVCSPLDHQWRRVGLEAAEVSGLSRGLQPSQHVTARTALGAGVFAMHVSKNIT
jgi:hypothetical protein